MTVQPIPTASLCIISYARLAKQDAEEVEALRQAFSRDGFAYLDLHEPDGSPGSVIHGVDSMFSMGADFFSTSLGEKMQYDIDAIGPYKLNGYEAFVTHRVLTPSVNANAGSVPTMQIQTCGEERRHCRK
jgi:isopenicillin N synthase-like dioxygenase